MVYNAIYNTPCKPNCEKCHSRYYIVGTPSTINNILLCHSDIIDGLAYYKEAGLYNVIVEYKRRHRPLHDTRCFRVCGVQSLIGVWSSILQDPFIKKEWTKMTRVYGFRACGYRCYQGTIRSIEDIKDVLLE